MRKVAQFEIYYDQYLDEGAKIIQDLPPFAQDPVNLISLYRMMMQTRLFDSKAIALQRTGKLGTYPSILGQEAVSVAIGDAMHAEDVLCPGYRDQGAQLARATTMVDLLNYWGGDERGSHFTNSEDFPIAITIASQCLHATGVATAFKFRQQPRVAVATCGDGATSKGDFYEALNIAGTWHLPMVFVVVNNHWAISVPTQKQTGCQTLAQKAIAGGIAAIQVDGNDVIAMRHQMELALDKARAGKGATLIEALTYRLGDHTTADDARRYRSEEELQQAWKREPIARLRTYLHEIGVWTENDEQQLNAECKQKIETSVNAYLAMPPQPNTAMFDSLYAELPVSLQEQYDEVKNLI